MSNHSPSPKLFQGYICHYCYNYQHHPKTLWDQILDCCYLNLITIFMRLFETNSFWLLSLLLSLLLSTSWNFCLQVWQNFLLLHVQSAHPSKEGFVLFLWLIIFCCMLFSICTGLFHTVNTSIKIMFDFDVVQSVVSD